MDGYGQLEILQNGKEYNYGQYENYQFGGVFDKNGKDYPKCRYKIKNNEVFNRTIIYLNNGENVSFYDNNKLEMKENSEGEIQNKKLTIGGAEWNYGISLNGSIYTLRFYNRALTEKEIEQNYNIDKIRYNITE
jgi:hypothetical protein